MSTGSGAGGGSFVKGRSDATICVMLWIVAGEELKTEGGSPSSGVCKSRVAAGAGGWRASGSIASTQGVCVMHTGCCGLLLALLGSLRGAGCSSRSSSWEQSRLTCSSLSMTRRNSGVPQVFSFLFSSSSTLHMGGLASGRPRSLRNLANPLRNSSKLAWNVLHSCSQVKLGAVLMGCGGQLSSLTRMSTTAALGGGGEILVGFPRRIFGSSFLLLR